MVLLPETGDFANRIDRAHLDCLANGERSTWDAIAIELLYEEKLGTRGLFSIQQIRKVQQDMPLEKLGRFTEYNKS